MQEYWIKCKGIEIKSDTRSISSRLLIISKKRLINKCKSTICEAYRIGTTLHVFLKIKLLTYIGKRYARVSLSFK